MFPFLILVEDVVGVLESNAAEAALYSDYEYIQKSIAAEISVALFISRYFCRIPFVWFEKGHDEPVNPLPPPPQIWACFRLS
jgi:hypothetical protein